MSAGPQAGALNGQTEVTTSTVAADPELEGLALSSDITELGYALEAVSTRIFEIQVRALLCFALLCMLCVWHSWTATRYALRKTAC